MLLCLVYGCLLDLLLAVLVRGHEKDLCLTIALCLTQPNPNLGKKPISLAQGDPTVYGHLKVPESAVSALVDVAKSYKYNGYAHSAGIVECRRYTTLARCAALTWPHDFEMVCASLKMGRAEH